jgi:hypothetical protein
MSNTESKQDSKLKQETVYKFSDNGKGELMEAVIITGKEYFIKYFHEGKYIKVNSIPNLKPPTTQEYPNNNPYEFQSGEETQIYLQRALKETPDSILIKIKNLVKKFNDVDEKAITLLSANIFGSYFQDRFSTVHYLIIVGANGTGKSAFGDTFESLGYRAVKVTNTTDAFWFRVFGNIEYGQVTIIVEEFDSMDERSQIMTVLKEGYQPNTRVPRMNGNVDKMEFFNPFGFKIIISEKSPNENKARGVLDRSFKIKSYKGIPDYNIKEIRNPQGNSNRQKLLDEINDLRKLLLMYRLVHIKDPYKEINIGLDGRDEELCKPLLQLFYTLEATEDTLSELESTLQHFLDIKNKRKGQTLEAVIYPVIVNIVADKGEKVPSSQLWQLITDSLEGKRDDLNENMFISAEYGKMYRNTVTGMICDKFGAEIDHRRHGNTIVFNSKTLGKAGKIYQTNQISIKPICDALTHRDHCEGQAILSNEGGINSALENVIPDTRINHDDNDESLNHKKKCPYCEYEEVPYWLKIHERFGHPE